MRICVVFLLSLAIVDCKEDKAVGGNEFGVKQLEERKVERSNRAAQKRPGKLDPQEENGRDDGRDGGSQTNEKKKAADQGAVESLSEPKPKKTRRSLDQLKQELLERNAERRAGRPEVKRWDKGSAAFSGEERVEAEPVTFSRGQYLKFEQTVSKKARLPFGKTLKARLAGPLVVSRFPSKTVFHIYEHGRQVGFGFVSGNIGVNNEVYLLVHEFAYKNKLYRGDFEVFGAGFSTVTGKVDRQLAKLILQGAATALFSGLAVTNNGDGLSDVILGNMANNALQQTNAFVNDKTLYKSVTVPKFTRILIVSHGDQNTSEEGIGVSNEDFRTAFDKAMANPANRETFLQYQRNANRMKDRR